MKTGTEGVCLSLRERQRLEREDVILDVALDMMRESGYAVMTMDDLAARVGISKPTLYTHFPSKEEIAVRAMMRMMQRGIEFMEGVASGTPAIDRIERVIRHLFSGKFIQHIFLGAARDVLVPTIRQRPDYQVQYQSMVAHLTQFIDDAKAEGAIRPELPTRLMVQTIISLLRDTEYQELLTQGGCKPEQVVETLTVVLLDGMKAQETR